MASKLSVEESNRQKDIIRELREFNDKEYAQSGKRNSFKITTLGCQMNLAV